MQSVISHLSHNSMNDFGEPLKRMFLDSEIVSKMEIAQKWVM